MFMITCAVIVHPFWQYMVLRLSRLGRKSSGCGCFDLQGLITKLMTMILLPFLSGLHATRQVVDIACTWCFHLFPGDFSQAG